MGKTISTHNGSTAYRGHNIRDERCIGNPDHIDPALTKDNMVLCDEKPREAYRRIFGEALRAYNEKQERPERRIKDYYTHIEQDAKKHAVYEMIVQIGDRNDTGLDAPTEKECLIQFYEGWKERNPNLECIGAYLHADEKDGTVHLHLDYVPVAHGYKRGMETQTGLAKALGEMGFVKQGKDTAQILWQRRENETLESIANAHGIEIEHPNRGVKHLKTEIYKAQAELEELREAADIEEQQADNWQEVAETYKGEAEQAQYEAAEAAERAKAIKEELNSIQSKTDAKKGEYEAIEDKLEQRKVELAAVEAAIMRGHDRGDKLFGTSEMNRRIAEAREQGEKDRRLKLLEKFVALPQVKAAFEQFCNSLKQTRRKDRGDR